MNRRLLTIVSCALVLSVCASYLVYRAMSGRPAAGRAATPSVQLVVASRDLVVGTVIHEGDLRMAAGLSPLPKGVSLKRDGLLTRGVSSAIYEGEPVTENRLAPKGSTGGLAATIPPGMRACAVRVNEVVGVAGFVVPGMRVDVLITGLPPGGSAQEGARVRTLLQNIQVLSAGINFQKDQEGKPEQAQVVNLLVTPEQAEILSLASNETHIQLVLRNPMDTQISKPPGTEMSDLFGGVRTPRIAPQERLPVQPSARRSPAPASAAAVETVMPPTRVYTVEVANGAVHTQARFSVPQAKQ